MKRYAVVFEESAQRAWGTRRAKQWVRQLRTMVFQRLAVAPKGFPLASEAREFSEEIRQMVAGCYRIEFIDRAEVLSSNQLYIEGFDGGLNR